MSTKKREHNMNCPTEDVLLDYIAGRLNVAQAAQFERHADRCAHCGELRAAQSMLWRSLDEWKPAPVSAGFNRELWRRIDADSVKTSWARAAFQFSFWKRVAPLAVALALVVTGFVFDHSGKPVGVDAGVQSALGAGAPIVVTVGEADQLDRALDDIQLLHEVDAASHNAAKSDSGVM
jgi:anti-sigma factor RsiW